MHWDSVKGRIISAVYPFQSVVLITSKAIGLFGKGVGTGWEQKRIFSNCLHFPETVEGDLIPAFLNVGQVELPRDKSAQAELP